METLRFLLTASSYPPFHLGGDAIHVRYLAEALAAQGHEVHVEYCPAALTLKGGHPGSAPPDTNGVHVHPITSPWGRWQPLYAYMMDAPAGIRQHHEDTLRQVQPDVVHYHNLSLLGLRLMAAPSRAIKLYTEHGFWLGCPRQDLFKYGRSPCDSKNCGTCMLVSGKPPQLWRRRRDAFDALHRLDATIAPSDFVKQKTIGLVAGPIHHIPNFAPDRNPSGRVLDPGGYYLFVGRLENSKGARVLAEAVSKYVGPHRFVVVGRGTASSGLEAARRQRPETVELHAWVEPEELGTFYRSARALLMPSIVYENSPLAAIEALSWGVPLLASSRGGLPELLYGERSGISFPPSAEGLLDGIARFEREDRSNRMRRDARTVYEAHHTPSQYLQQYHTVIEQAWKTRNGTSSAPAQLSSAIRSFDASTAA
ncbi:MAG TPA: glycosyltransferase [Thermoplasmata archaeon]|nr:glycosyltransferase [Thermoplasmata archaeon]